MQAVKHNVEIGTTGLMKQLYRLSLRLEGITKTTETYKLISSHYNEHKQMKQGFTASQTRNGLI
jgi:hypothetical protein